MADVPKTAKDGMGIVGGVLVPLTGALFGWLMADLGVMEEKIYSGLVKKFTPDQLHANNDEKLKEIILFCDAIPFMVYLSIAFAGLGYAFTGSRAERVTIGGIGGGFVGGAGAGAAANKVFDMLGGHL
jgi:hypothetical protein